MQHPAGAELRALVRDIPDFPKPGILFRDVTPLLGDGKAFRTAVEALAEPFRNARIDRVLGIESRGFILGAPVALVLDAGLVIVRKAGKLPWRTHQASYDLEYGTDRVEMHVDAVRPGERVLVVDDLIATGGTAAASVRLAREAGAEVVGCAFLIELSALGGRARLDTPTVHVVIRY
jgi:adenine phosphoribosyltransferase